MFKVSLNHSATEAVKYSVYNVYHSGLLGDGHSCILVNFYSCKFDCTVRVRESAMLKDRDYDVTPYIIAHILRQIRGWSAKSTRWEPEVIGTGSARNRK